MDENEQYSCTSNTVKLLKHLTVLSNLQNGIISPIMVHIIPTHKCQLKCVHCCFRNRKDKLADMELDVFIQGIQAFIELGVNAFEFTGGGDPLLWEHMNIASKYLYVRGKHCGLITNGLALNELMFPEYFDWVRVSLNTLDYIFKDYEIKAFTDKVRSLKEKTEVSFCYIWNEFSDRNIEKIIAFSNEMNIVCRIAPDCIQPLHKIEEDIKHIRSKLEFFSNNKKTFLSDFNIDLVRKNNHCRIHMIKPCFYLDGWVYACPSAELAVENDRQVQEKARICHYTDIAEYYISGRANRYYELNCSYCKYVKQQEFLEDLLMETFFNDFA